MVAESNESAIFGGWLATGLRSMIAGALRSAAAVLNDLADWVDGTERRPSPALLRVVARDGDGSQPLDGTRERIADALGRARHRYDAVTSPDGPRRGGGRPRPK